MEEDKWLTFITARSLIILKYIITADTLTFVTSKGVDTLMLTECFILLTFINVLKREEKDD